MIAIASALKDLKSPAALARVHELDAKIEAHFCAHEGTLLRLINIQDVSDIDQRIRPIDPKVIRGKISEKSKAWDALEAVLKDGLAPWLKMRLLEAAKSSDSSCSSGSERSRQSHRQFHREFLLKRLGE